ncbi:MAG TPA: Rid family hydrolase [Acidimicrobiales bacterium]|nr:Rid family hydrolase [Acidimicrobiales bacterium]
MTAPIGPYSSIVRAGPWLACSGQLGVLDGAIVAGGVPAQTEQALANLSHLLAGEGASLDDVVKATVFLTDMAEFSAMNEVYAAAFTGRYPARSTIAVVALPCGGDVEIEAWAYRPEPSLPSDVAGVTGGRSVPDVVPTGEV